MILPNHGALAVGRALHDVFKICRVVEKTTHIYIMALRIGTPYLIPKGDIEAMQCLARNVYEQM